MKTPKIFATMSILALLLSVSCGKPPKEKDSAAGPGSGPGSGKVATRAVRPRAMLELHYRIPARLDELKKELTAVAGPAVGLIWPHLESLKGFSAWVFEPPDPTPGKLATPKFVLCITGKATDWLYLAQLQSPEGAPVAFVKDQVQKIKGPEGAHPVYFLLDKGGAACLGSTEALARDAHDWSAPALPSDGVVLLLGHVPSLFSLGAQQDFAAAMESMMALSGVTAKQLQEFKALFAGMEETRLQIDLGADLASLVRLDFVWKEAPAFFAAPGKSRLPFTGRTLFDLHLEFAGGRWMGIDLWPLFEAETAADLREKVKKFLTDLRSIDVQIALGDGGRIAHRIDLRADGQEAFLMEAAGKLQAGAGESDQFSVREVSRTDDLLVWEATPTAAAAPNSDYRLIVERLFGGVYRFESRREKGGVVWTGGTWPEAPAFDMPADNLRAVISLLPMVNLVLPLIEEKRQTPPPRFTPYPSVPPDPWRVSLRLDPAKKTMTIETSLPYGPWLRSMKTHPALLERLNQLQSPAPAKTAPPSDL